MPSPNFGWGEGLNTPAPPCSAAYCAKDAYRQSRPVLAHMDISLRAFSLGACTAISKNSSQRGRRRGRNNLGNGDFGRARKQAKVGEGSETARRLGRFSSNLVPRAFPLKNGWGGKRPWHRLVTCLLVHPKILGVMN